jgi:hypothetical protein
MLAAVFVTPAARFPAVVCFHAPDRCSIRADRIFWRQRFASLDVIHPIKSRRRAVEGGGPVGCGCGFIIGFSIAMPFLMTSGGLGVWLALGIAAAIGALTWIFGEVVLEKMLAGDPEGKPLRYWRWW